VTCEEADQFLMRFVFDDLSDEDRSRFEEHLAECLDCRSYFQSYLVTVRLGRAAFQDPAASCDESLPPGLLRAILATAGR
jgi:anti-sigma factor RsiW